MKNYLCTVIIVKEFYSKSIPPVFSRPVTELSLDHCSLHLCDDTVSLLLPPLYSFSL